MNLGEVAARLEDLTAYDREHLGRRLERVRRTTDARKRAAELQGVAAAVEQAERRVEVRRNAVPEITYPEELPVSQLKDEIAAAIRDHQVVVVAGETGSGKTTQIPKICLELGRGVHGMIGHTQPRRLAARTVAERIAEELGTELGETIGFAVRFTDKVSERSLVKLMTDGILLNELQRDRDLTRYDTLIIDEAHERSLNIDFILGYLERLLPRRPDLKVIITSATIDPERFAAHFAAADGTPAPIVEVSGRTYPVEVRYRPVNDPEDPRTIDRDQTQAILDAVDELEYEADGDVLVFLSGEREIRDTADALNDKFRGERRTTEILPLYARLSNAEQHRVFQPHANRRIVLATNVAETSLTVPGIKYVIDPGTARISRYSHRTKVQHLPIEPVSQASANQRKGRCGRTSDGICIRLYSEEDFDNRPEFTEPEILRTNLASVILQMTAIGLGDIAAFPFIDEPDKRSITDGLQLLTELGAIDTAEGAAALTPIGRQLAQIPLDPRLARMIVEADKHACVREVMVIAAALSIQDPRERPTDAEAQAQQAHARFRDPNSDFLGYLNLWGYLKKQQKELSGNQFRRMCRSEYLNYLRVREWQDIFAQLRQVATQIGVKLNSGEPADPQSVHIALMSGLLCHLGMKDPANQHQYLGARGTKFAIFPGSGLFKKPPQFVMAAELVETSKLWARVNAKIEPEWAEDLAPHLIKRSYSEPHWERKAGAVMAYEKVTLYGVPIVARRKVNYGKVDPEVSRELFIRHALVEGDWDTHHKFFHENRKLIEEVEELEERTRRRDLLVDDETLFAFYDERLGPEVVTGRHFDTWWKTARQRDADLLDFERSLIVREGADVKEDEFPLRWTQNGMTFDLTYAFEPGTDADGVTVHLPLLVLNQVTADGFEWSVPGFREELVTTLIKSLPKAIRRNIVPAPDHARQILPELDPASGPLTDAMARALRDLRGVVIETEDWDWTRVPEHLRMTFRVEDDKRKTVAEGKDLAKLKEKLKPKTKAAISQVASKAVSGLEKAGLTDWTLRRSAAQLLRAPQRADGRGLPGARRRGQERRDPPAGDRTRSGRGDVGGYAAASAADDAVGDRRRTAESEQSAEDDADGGSASQRRRAARRCDRGGCRSADGGRGWTGVEPDRVLDPAGRRTVGSRGHRADDPAAGRAGARACADRGQADLPRRQPRVARCPLGCPRPTRRARASTGSSRRPARSDCPIWCGTCAAWSSGWTSSGPTRRATAPAWPSSTCSPTSTARDSARCRPASTRAPNCSRSGGCSRNSASASSPKPSARPTRSPKNASAKPWPTARSRAAGARVRGRRHGVRVGRGFRTASRCG